METPRGRTIELTNVPGEGWFINLWMDGRVIANFGPTKVKPPMSRLRRLQWKHFQGHKCDVVLS